MARTVTPKVAALIERGRQQARASDFQEAARSFERALQQMPELTEVQAMRAESLQMLGRLDDAEMRDFEQVALALGMAVLVEVHDERELDRALALRTPLVGINNRNLRTFEVTLETTLALLPRIPPGRVVVTESGIGGAADVRRMRAAGVGAFLVGEAFMRAGDPGVALAGLLA